LSDIKARFEGCDLVFLDPDNGIAPEGFGSTSRRVGKSVMIEDIEALKQDGQAIVVYHHQTHRKSGHHVELRDLALRLTRSGFLVSGVLRAKPWSPRAFFILNGDHALRSRAGEIATTWGRRICWIPNPAANETLRFC